MYYCNWLVTEPSTVSPKMYWEEWFWNGIDRYDSYGEWYRTSTSTMAMILMYIVYILAFIYIHIYIFFFIYIYTRNEYNLSLYQYYFNNVYI